MTQFKSRCINCLSVLVLTGGLVSAQTGDKPGAKVDRSAAYYDFTLGHIYAELASAYGNRGDYLNKAIEYYRLAMDADPRASFLADDLSDLYIQAGRLKDAVTEFQEAVKKHPDDLNARRLLARIYTRLIGDDERHGVNETMLTQAIEQYRQVGDRAPADTETWLMLGRLYKVAQNSVEAEKAYKKVLVIDPNNEDALTGLAMVYTDVGDTKSAMEMLKRAADQKPDLHTLLALSGTYEQMHEYALAAQTLQRALDMQPGNTDIKRAVAQDLMLSEQYDAALKAYQELAQEDPRDYVAELRISQIYRQQHDFAKAREASDKAKQIDPDNIEIRYNEVNLLEAEGRLPDAIAMMKSIVDSTARKSYSQNERGNRVALIERLGLLYRSNSQYDEAAQCFRQIPEVDPDLAARAEAQIVDTYRIGKEYAKAREEGQAALKKYPKDRVLRSVWASLLADEGKGAEAAAEMKTLLDGKDDRETWLSLAQIYEKSKDFDQMSKAIDAAGKLSTSKEDQENIHFMRGAMYERMKKYQAAEEEFRKVLELNPENSSALNYLGYMFADRNQRLQEAEDLISKALQQEPNNGAYLDSMGWVLFRLNKLPEAEHMLVRAVERTGSDPTVHDHLGDVYFHQGKIKEAIGQWESSMKAWETSAPTDQDPDEMAKVQKKLEGARVRLAKETPGRAQNDKP